MDKDLRARFEAGQIDGSNVAAVLRDVAITQVIQTADTSGSTLWAAASTIEHIANGALKAYLATNFEDILDVLRNEFDTVAETITANASRAIPEDASPAQMINDYGKAGLDATKRVHESSERLDYLRGLIERLGSAAGVRVSASRFADPGSEIVELPERASWLAYLSLGCALGLNDAARVAEIEANQAIVRESIEAEQWRSLIMEEEQRLAELQDGGFRASSALQIPPEFAHLRDEVQSQLGTTPSRGRRVGILL
jgi:hypothetical protein